MTPEPGGGPPVALAARIDAALPQTQCRRCGYPGCRPYADALAAGEAAPNRCPPGGQGLADRLARLVGREPLSLDPACGAADPWRVARIDESACIGCTLCIQACPVDAILGAARRMHTVLEAECTGCELCLPPCPVDCIDLLPMRNPLPGAAFLEGWMAARADLARRRHERREARLARLVAERAARARRRSVPSRERRRAEVAAAVERVRARRRAAPRPPP